MDVDIVLDAGHGGFDNGASYMGRAEKDDVLRLTLAVGAKLKEAGYHVYYTRTTDIYNSPTEKQPLPISPVENILFPFTGIPAWKTICTTVCRPLSINMIQRLIRWLKILTGTWSRSVSKISVWRKFRD